MAKYRKKPVVVEAIQYTGDNATEISNWTKQLSSERYIEEGPDYLLIQTLEGTMKAIPGDFIIKGVKNEYYPCKPDIFEQTYEKIWGEITNMDVLQQSISNLMDTKPGERLFEPDQNVIKEYLNQQKGDQ